jgi:hypothetical protein
MTNFWFYGDEFAEGGRAWKPQLKALKPIDQGGVVPDNGKQSSNKELRGEEIESD